MGFEPAVQSFGSRVTTAIAKVPIIIAVIISARVLVCVNYSPKVGSGQGNRFDTGLDAAKIPNYDSVTSTEIYLVTGVCISTVNIRIELINDILKITKEDRRIPSIRVI